MRLKHLLLSLLIAPTALFSQSINFDAKAILYLNDADMSPYSIIDGNLRKTPGSKDQLSVLNFPLSYGSGDQIKSVNTSNSLLSQAETICLRSDEQIAYVVEVKSETDPEVNFIGNIKNEFPDGEYVTVVSLKDLKNPKALYRFPVGNNPTSLDLDPSNKNLLICSGEYGQELRVFELNEEGKPVRIISKPKNFAEGRISHAEWHSSGKYIIYINRDTQEVGMIKVLRDGPSGQIIRLEPHGTPIKIDGMPTSGGFTPDQRYFLVLDVNNDFISEPKNKTNGKLFVIKFNLEEDSETAYLLSKIEVGNHPQSFAVHPDGNFIAVCNIEDSFLPPNTINNNKGSISILKLDFNGTVKSVGNIVVEGVFPNSACFDKSGNNLAVSVSQFVTFGYSFGGLNFYRFTPEKSSPLELQKGKVFLPAGVHSIKALTAY
ncbi:hypothetical protein SAMN06298216_4325 [Spirosomataceae bacterium TFI 002]|nr:hypothetical protein SAMN06298216_4325 [Spirosomataceae bacterium TFI 002]